MGICCCKDDIILDSAQFTRSYDSLSYASSTPFYYMSDDLSCIQVTQYKND